LQRTFIACSKRSKTWKKELEAAPREKHAAIEQKLRQAKAARNRMRRILDGQLDR
jgi:hypothetical protein